MPTCSRCGEAKDVVEFCKNKRTCKKCHREGEKRRRDSDPEHNAKCGIWRDKNRERINARARETRTDETREKENRRYRANPAIKIIAATKYYHSNKERVKDQHRFVKYGMSKDDFIKMLESQGGLCCICRKELSPETRYTVIDHCHATQQVRGILCSLCNSGLGSFRDNETFLAEAIRYLQRAREREGYRLLQLNGFCVNYDLGDE